MPSTMTQKKTLLDRVRNSLRQRIYAHSTKQSYVNWVKRYTLFHNKQHPKTMGEMIGMFVAML